MKMLEEKKKRKMKIIVRSLSVEKKVGKDVTGKLLTEIVAKAVIKEIRVWKVSG